MSVSLGSVKMLVLAYQTFWLYCILSGVDPSISYACLRGVQVLCFSDTRDQYSQAVNSEDSATLARRLDRLDSQLKVHTMTRLQGCSTCHSGQNRVNLVTMA